MFMVILRLSTCGSLDASWCHDAHCSACCSTRCGSFSNFAAQTRISNGQWEFRIRMANEKFESNGKWIESEWQMKNFKWQMKSLSRMANEIFKSEWQMKSSNPNGKWNFQMANEKFESNGKWKVRVEWQMKFSNPNGKWNFQIRMANEIFKW